MPDFKVVQDFYLFEFGGIDVVWGYEWLASLGEIQANFKEQVVKMVEEGRVAEISGDAVLSRTAVASWIITHKDME